jgi:hypothetical protein
MPLFLLCPKLPQTTADRQGTFHQPPNPGLKPWAVLFSRFAAKSNTSLRNESFFLTYFQAINCQATIDQSLRDENIRALSQRTSAAAGPLPERVAYLLSY